MSEEIINGVKYKLPGLLTDFQKDMYVHLINWKWKHITKEVGEYTRKTNGVVKRYEYDAILPKSVHKNFPLIYPAILQDLKQHHKEFYFKFHKHFNHMASSQAANANLFLPILLHPKVNEIIRCLKPDIGFDSLATDKLYKGFRIEFWDGNSNNENGLLGDHSAISGTDSDIAIAYYNKENELCLWLIEHKLTEKEFTSCGGFKSKGNKNKSNCDRSFQEILENKDYCYCHNVKHYNYWNITEANKDFFLNHKSNDGCPFKDGLNQLWRNQLLALSIERNEKQPYKHVFFSVVKHPNNSSLDGSIDDYRKLIDTNSKFSVFTSSDVLKAATFINAEELNKWIKWYKNLYLIP